MGCYFDNFFIYFLTSSEWEELFWASPVVSIDNVNDFQLEHFIHLHFQDLDCYSTLGIQAPVCYQMHDGHDRIYISVTQLIILAEMHTLGVTVETP